MNELALPIEDAPLLHLPAVDPAEADFVTELLDELFEEHREAQWQDGGTVLGHLDALDQIIPLVEAVLDQEPSDVSHRMIARVVFMAAHPSIPEGIALQIAFGRRVAERNLEYMERVFARAAQQRLSVDEYVLSAVAIGSFPTGSAARLLRGEPARRPDSSRITRGIALLRRAAALVPEPIRGDLLAVLGWLHWARGQRGIAFAYLNEALRSAPYNILAFGLRQHFGSVARPAWLTGGTSRS